MLLIRFSTKYQANKLKHFVIFGAGLYAFKCIKLLKEKCIFDVSIVDNDQNKYGQKIDGHLVQNPLTLENLSFDQLIITSTHIHEIKIQLENDFHIPEQKILIYNQKSNRIQKWIPLSHSTSLTSNAIFFDLVEHLPPISRIKNECGEVDLYGVRHTIANLTRTKGTPKTKAQWMHGWYAVRSNNPRMYVTAGNYNSIKNVPYLTNLKRETAILKKGGVSKSIATGANFLYAKPKRLPKRVSGSVLIVPGHNTEACPNNVNTAETFERLEEKINLQTNLTVRCIGGSDLLNKTSKNALYNELPFICGAWIFDENALHRMWIIFSTFETLVTDTIGSHIPYALACGTKVEIIDLGTRMDVGDKLKNEPFFKNNPDLFEPISMGQSIYGIKQNFPEIFTASTKQERIDTGYKLLGHENMKEIEEITSLFGWN